MEKQKPKVGDKLFSLNIGNAARNCEQKLTEFFVTKVGRKYFYAGYKNCPDHLIHTYYLKDWREKSVYSEDSELYKTKESWEIKKESYKICKNIYRAFEYGRNTAGINIEDLRKINEMIIK